MTKRRQKRSRRLFPSRQRSRVRRHLLETLEDRRMLATFTVDSPLDVVNPGDGVTTLREALQQSNDSAGVTDTITFAAALDNQTINLSAAGGQLVVSDGVNITHDGPNQVTINGAMTGTRVMTIGTPAATGSFDVMLKGLVITGGATTTAGNNTGTNTDGGDGGGLRSFTSGTVTLQNSSVSGNSTAANNADGGGIFARNGTLTLQNSTVSNNTTAGNYIAGGGIYHSAGTLNITGGTISGNIQAVPMNPTILGGGIFIQNDSTANIMTSTISGNTSDNGGGIYNAGTLTLSGSTVSGNTGMYRGGGIYEYGMNASIQNSTISGNNATQGGGFYDYGAGTSIRNSTISGNRATTQGGGIRGGQRNPVTVSQSTISGNRTTGAAGQGGGLYGFGTITNSTITNNTASAGGGVFAAMVTISSTIISGNTGGDINDPFAGAMGFVTSNGNNLVGDGTSSGAFNAAGDQMGITNPMLGALADNGGTTFTHVPAAVSPVIDMGAQPMTPLATDQRGAGFARVSGASIDVGAVEFAPPNTAPTITNIGDQVTAINTATAALPVMINDAETAPAALVLSAASSNPALVPVGNVTFGGAGAAQTVTVTPAAGQVGMSTITVTVTDGGGLTAMTNFMVTVNAANTAPTITNIGDQVTAINTATAALPVMINDAETAPAALVLSAASSNPALVPAGNVTFGGAGAAQTVTVTPAAGQTGTSTITVTVTDGGGLTAMTNFMVTVNAANTAPTITNIGDQVTAINTATAAIPVMVNDVETAPATLALSAASSNPALVPAGNVTFGGAGAARTVTVTPAAGQVGMSTITVTVTDGGGLTAMTNFMVTVNAANTAPTITNIGDQVTAINTATAAIPVMINDAETAPATLALSAASSNPALVPAGNVTFGGAGAARTVTVTPAAGQTGTSTITVTVTDGGGLTAMTNFMVTVNAPGQIQIRSAIPAGLIDPVLPSGPAPTSWAQQRSSLRVIEIDLPNALVADATPAGLVLTNRGVEGTAMPIPVALSASQIATSVDRRRITLTFAENALSDGVYHLQILGALTGGAAINIPGTLQNRFFVLRGDWNGDGIITNGDFAPFAYWFLNATPPPYMDLRSPTGINVQDFTVFLQTFGTNLFPMGVSQQSVGALIAEGEALLEALGSPSVPLAATQPAPNNPPTTSDTSNPLHSCGPVESGIVPQQRISSFDSSPSIGPVPRSQLEFSSSPPPRGEFLGPKTFQEYQEDLIEETIEVLSRDRL